MPASKDFLICILDGLRDLDDVTYRRMMGEYIIYYHGKISAYICDDRLLVKPVPSAIRLLPDAEYQAPYPGAKEMLLVENVEDSDFLRELFVAMESELPEARPKQKNKKRE